MPKEDISYVEEVKKSIATRKTHTLPKPHIAHKTLTFWQSFSSSTGTEEPPGMTACRLDQPPRTPPQWRSSSSRRVMDISSSTTIGLFTWPGRKRFVKSMSRSDERVTNDLQVHKDMIEHGFPRNEKQNKRDNSDTKYN